MSDFIPPCYFYNSVTDVRWDKQSYDNCNGGIAIPVTSNVCTVLAVDSNNLFTDTYSIEQNFINGCLGSFEFNITNSEIVTPKNITSSTPVDDYNFVSSSFIVLGLFFIVGYLVAK